MMAPSGRPAVAVDIEGLLVVDDRAPHGAWE